MKQVVRKLIQKCAEKARVEIYHMSHDNKHIKVFVRGNKTGLVFVSATASDHRAFKNVVTDMRREVYDQANGKQN